MDYTDIRMQLEAVEDKEIGEKTLFYNIPIVKVKNGAEQEYHPLFMDHMQQHSNYEIFLSSDCYPWRILGLL